MARDGLLELHHAWRGMVQPTGLFLAPRVLADAGAAPTEPIIDTQSRLADLVVDGVLRDPLSLFTEVLDWPSGDVFTQDPAALDKHTLRREGGVTVAPSFALYDLDEHGLVALGMFVSPDTDLDTASDDPVWTATPQQRFDALLRDQKCAVGIITNQRVVRIVYAPAGEATAHASWNVADLLSVAGRPLLAALHMCLNTGRLLTLEAEQRLPALLARSREFQNTVSTRLQGQVLDALQELLDGLQRADRITDGRLLSHWRGSDDDRQTIYHGLVTALLRMVFVLFAEERRLLPLDAKLYRASYALTDLHARLLEDHHRLGARLDARYGAWARVIALFRLLHEGLDARRVPDGFYIPARRGEFFDPDRFAFLEGRAPGARPDGPLELPKISDGAVFRVLDKLLVLDGERLKYSDLAVEQIGSVYEGIMGYTLELAEGRALRIRLDRKSGSLDVVVDLQRFADLSRKDFSKHLTEGLELKLSDATLKAIAKCEREDDVAAVLSQQKSFKNTTAIERGWMYLQPGEERRRSGSHYTPRALTQPIVERTLAPVLSALGESPTPDEILSLRVCDPAMGSGAFLVEVCRQLAVRLEEAWKRHDAVPSVPPDEDLHLHARRRVAQRCLYGVDKNPLAVELARLSLWLETFARDHAFTFLDHCLRHGDSLVGLSLDQIASVSLDTRKGTQLDLVRKVVHDTLAKVRRLRGEIHTAGDGDPPDNEAQRSLWREAQNALLEARTVGDLVVAGFFSQKSDRDRAKWIEGHHVALSQWIGGDAKSGKALRDEVAKILDEKSLVPFHWPLEFPEVFERGGFDCFVGNPPFLGGTRISTNYGTAYLEWLTRLFEGTGNRTDLVAYFFRRSFSLFREGGTFGLIATNTIAQGDTRNGGLKWICTNGGTIYGANRRYKWPGLAAVIVSIIHIVSGGYHGRRELDGRNTSDITAFLFHRGGHDAPTPLADLPFEYFTGSKIYSPGFTFDDREKKRDTVSSLSEMHALIAKDTRNRERIFPYLGGEELNDDPEQKPHRYVINFGEMSEVEARHWPDLIAIIEAKVRPGRMNAPAEVRALPWWLFQRLRAELYRSIQGKQRVLANSQVSQHLIFAWVPSNWVYAHTLNIFSEDRDASLAVMQSRIHEVWTRFFASSLEDRLRYTPSDCFETFPFPAGWETSAALEDIGRRYHEHRAAVMKRTVGTKKPEGLTATYNRFHDRNERDREILRLRELHAEMDRAVLDAYGWTDIRPVYDFRVQLDERVRLTWDDDTRDDVLARLLEENRRRASSTGSVARRASDDESEETSAEESDAGERAVSEEAPAKSAPKTSAKRGRPKKGEGTPGLPGVE